MGTKIEEPIPYYRPHVGSAPDRASKTMFTTRAPVVQTVILLEDRTDGRVALTAMHGDKRQLLGHLTHDGALHLIRLSPQVSEEMGLAVVEGDSGVYLRVVQDLS